jgi:hypothetical protein
MVRSVVLDRFPDIRTVQTRYELVRQPEPAM